MFYLFWWSAHDEEGGANDFHSRHENLEDAIYWGEAQNDGRGYYRGHITNEKMEIVCEVECNFTKLIEWEYESK